MSHKELIYVIASPDMAQVQPIYKEETDILNPPYPYLCNGWYVRRIVALPNYVYNYGPVNRQIGVLRPFNDHPDSRGSIEAIHDSAVPPELESFFDSLLLVL